MYIFEIFNPFDSSHNVMRWKSPRNSDSYVPVWIDVSKLDASWKQDKRSYITPNGGGNSIKGRYERFGEWLKQGLPIEMPEVSISDWRDCATFGNGRHRFAYLRDHGTTSLPVLVPIEQAEEIKKRFGT